MLIECTIKRANGTTVTMDKDVYPFQPDALGRHVCDVKNKKHIARFLDIPESYQDVTPKKPAIPEPPAEQVETNDQAGIIDNSADAA